MILIDKINHLRSHAAFLFDVGKKQGHSPEEIALTIRPLVEILEKEIARSSLKERAMAVKMLESQIEAHTLDHVMIVQKIEDCQNYITSIKNSIKKENHTEDGYTVTVIDGEINIR